MPKDFEVNLESPVQKEVVELIRTLDEYLASLYPASSNHLLSVESLSGKNVRFVVARLAGKAVGCGALVLDERGYGEIKRMYVSPESRGHGIGKEILDTLEKLASESSCKTIRLETGFAQHAALHLYRSAGYMECSPFGDYGPDPMSVFMEGALS